MELSTGFCNMHIMGCVCSENNDTDKLLNNFKIAVHKNEDVALESIWIDFGGENIAAARYQFLHVSVEGVRTGTFTRNQRIGRMWRDLTGKVGIFYKELLQYYADESPMVNRFILHNLLIGRIYVDTQIFVESWKRHGIRIEGEKSPVQFLLLHEYRSCGVATDAATGGLAV